MHDWAAKGDTIQAYVKKSIDIGGPHLDENKMAGMDPATGKPRQSGQDTVRMAVDAVKSKYPEILQKQKHLLKIQDRYTDQYYGINITRSDAISMDRDINNFVPEACLNYKYNRSNLATVSTLSIP